MEARGLTLLALLVPASLSLAATYKSENFTVTAQTPEVAREVAETAERHRKELAVQWLGEELRPWYHPCPIHVKDGPMGAGGWTKFTFVPYQGEIHVNGWDMRVQGSLERILDSVIPHEVTHTILATHFRRPLPRWADEGASTLAEHESERRRQLLTLKQVLQSNQAIPLRTLLDMKDYPTDMQKVYTLYAQGYSLSDLLVQQGGGGEAGRGRFLKFLGTAHRRGWDEALRSMYGYKNISNLETQWRQWVLAGSPDVGKKASDLANLSPARRGSGKDTIRSQSPEEDPFLGTGSEVTGRSRTEAKPTALPPEPKQFVLLDRDPSGQARTRPDNLPSSEAGESLPSYVAEDQPLALPHDIGDDDAWELELVPATITQATTRLRGAPREDGNLAKSYPARRSQADQDPDRLPAKPFRRTQSDFPQEFRWETADNHRASAG